MASWVSGVSEASRVPRSSSRVPRPPHPAPLSNPFEVAAPNVGAGVRGIGEVDPIPGDAVTDAEATLNGAEERNERGQFGESLEQRATAEMDLDHDPVRAANLGN